MRYIVKNLNINIFVCSHINFASIYYYSKSNVCLVLKLSIRVKTTHNHYDLIIAGAGIVGSSVAYHATLKGLSVLIMDTKGPFSGASGASDGAVSICTKKSGALTNLALDALKYYNSLSFKNNILSKIYHKRPSYYFSTNDKEDQAIDDLSNKIKTLGNPVSIKSDRPGKESINGLGDKIHRVLEVAGEGHILGYEAVNTYLNSQNIKHAWPCRLTRFEENSSHVKVHTDLGTYIADHLIIATGVSAGLNLPNIIESHITPRSGQLIITDRTTSTSDLKGPLTSASYLLSKSYIPSELSSPPIVIDSLSTGQFLIGSSREDNSGSSTTDFLTVKRILSHASSCFPPLLSRQVIRVFAGVRAAVEDGHPIVGPISSHARVLLAKGFEGDGICLSAIIGREIIDFIRGKEFSKDVQTLTPERFTV